MDPVTRYRIEQRYQQQRRKGKRMSDAQSPDEPNATPIPVRIKAVQITLSFTAQTDEEALAVKGKINKAIGDLPQITTQFGIQDMPMPNRR